MGFAGDQMESILIGVSFRDSRFLVETKTEKYYFWKAKINDK